MIKIALTEVSIDSDLQPRAMITESVVEEYAEAMSNGSSFPPITVFSNGEKNWLADGYHRFHAARKAGLDKISAEFRTGTKLDALKYALSLNMDCAGTRRIEGEPCLSPCENLGAFLTVR